MFGLTEFEIRKKGKTYEICLVDGKSQKVVMVSTKTYASKDTAFNAALKWWNKMYNGVKKTTYFHPVRFSIKK